MTGVPELEPTHIWRSKNYDYPCTPAGEGDQASDGRIFVEIRAPDGSQTFVPKDELVLKETKPVTDKREVREFIETITAQAKAATKHLPQPGLLQMLLVQPLDESVV